MTMRALGPGRRVRGPAPRPARPRPWPGVEVPLLASSRQRRQDREDVTLLDRRVQGLKEADVLVVDVDVHEPVQRTVGLGDLALESGIAAVQVVDELSDRAALADDRLCAHDPLQYRRNLYLDSQPRFSLPAIAASLARCSASGSSMCTGAVPQNSS